MPKTIVKITQKSQAKKLQRIYFIKSSNRTITFCNTLPTCARYLNSNKFQPTGSLALIKEENR